MQVLSIQECTSGGHANDVGLSVIHHWYRINQREKWMEQGSCLLWCPNLTNVDKYKGEFGLQIYLLVGFLTVLQVGLKRSLNSLTTNTWVVASPKMLSILELASSPLSCISLLVLLFSPSVYFFLSFFLPLAYFFSPLIYSPLSGIQIIIISPSSMQSHFHPKSQGINTFSEDSLDTCSRRQIVLDKDFLKALLVLCDYLNFSTSSLISYCLDSQQ